jgi:pyruvate/2-oxoglutarate/acetoin dehydrogenase E1 component
MKVKTSVKAGGWSLNHSERMAAGAAKAPGLRIKSSVKAGGIIDLHNHSEAMTRAVAHAPGLRIKIPR